MGEVVAAVPGLALLLQVVSDWIHRRDVPIDIHGCYLIEKEPFVTWGPLTRGKEYLGRYCLIRLPSYAWELCDYNQRMGWHQRWLAKRTGHPWEIQLRAIPGEETWPVSR